MKKRSIKKGLIALIMMLVVFGSFLAVKAATVKADPATAQAQVVLTLDDFAIADYVLSSKTLYLAFNTRYTDVYAEIQLLDSNKNPIQTIQTDRYSSTYYSIPFATAKNKIYYYHIRPYVKDNGAIVYVGDWSPYRALSSIDLPNKAPKNVKGVKFRCPKVAGVKSVKVMMKKNLSGKAKKLVTIKPGKTTKTIKKFDRKNFALWTRYYYYPVPTLNDKTPCDNIYSRYIEFTRKVVSG